jgi:hypothetical protein
LKLAKEQKSKELGRLIVTQRIMIIQNNRWPGYLLTVKECAILLFKNRDLSKRLLFQVRWRFVFLDSKVDWDKLIGNLLFNENGNDTPSAGGLRTAVNFENHVVRRGFR